MTVQVPALAAGAATTEMPNSISSAAMTAANFFFTVDPFGDGDEAPPAGTWSTMGARRRTVLDTLLVPSRWAPPQLFLSVGRGVAACSDGRCSTVRLADLDEAVGQGGVGGDERTDLLLRLLLVGQ